MDKLLLTPEEVAERLSIGRTAVFKAIREGKLESVKFGRSRRIPTDALAAFVAKLREGASDLA